jgi:NAD(P)-dependent dehydrogenase (short-subunit alcohol dehydrogenase family)
MRSVLITGANRGIGFEFARQYAADTENRVFATCRDPAKAEALQKLATQSDGRLSVHALDVGSEASVTALAKDLRDQPLDVLINNAGIAGDLRDEDNPPMGYEMWADVFRINTMAPYRMARAFRPQLERGVERKLITISSGRGSHSRHRGNGYAYCASKAAVSNVMYGMSVEWKPDNIIVVLLAPGPVRTDMNLDGRLTPEYSVGNLRRVIAGLTMADTGRYIDYEAKDVAW